MHHVPSVSFSVKRLLSSGIPNIFIQESMIFPIVVSIGVLRWTIRSDAATCDTTIKRIIKGLRNASSTYNTVLSCTLCVVYTHASMGLGKVRWCLVRFRHKIIPLGSGNDWGCLVLSRRRTWGLLDEGPVYVFLHWHPNLCPCWHFTICTGLHRSSHPNQTALQCWVITTVCVFLLPRDNFGDGKGLWPNISFWWGENKHWQDLFIL